MTIELLSHGEPYKESNTQTQALLSKGQPSLHPTTPSSPTALTLAANGPARVPNLASNISIEHLIPDTLPSFRRLISLLLPIRYPDKFFSEILSEPAVSALSRVAVWHDRPRPGKRKHDSDRNEDFVCEVTRGIVVGGIRCHLEPIPVPPGISPAVQQQLYIQTIAVLSPYRSQGIATSLLEAVVEEVLENHYNVTSIYAHVWESNELALEWYSRRGFATEEKLLEGYYRRLKPGGARIVRRMIGVKDHLKKTTAKERQGNSYQPC